MIIKNLWYSILVKSNYSGKGNATFNYRFLRGLRVCCDIACINLVSQSKEFIIYLSTNV